MDAKDLSVTLRREHMFKIKPRPCGNYLNPKRGE
jgi:hypothetical protein